MMIIFVYIIYCKYGSNFKHQCFVSQPSDATKNVAQSINYEIKLKQSEFERNSKKILGFERVLSKKINCKFIMS